MAELIHRIVAPHFVAGAISEEGRIIDAAPILRYAIGRQVGWLEAYCTKKGWQFQTI